VNAPNLMSHRASASVWDRRGGTALTVEERIGPWLVSFAGAGLLSYGATQGSWRGVWYLIGGVGLISCVAAGLYNPRDAAACWRHLRRDANADPITAEAMDSFPASDAPSSNATMTAGARSVGPSGSERFARCLARSHASYPRAEARPPVSTSTTHSSA
jgi:hypothetical protein